MNVKQTMQIVNTFVLIVSLVSIAPVIMDTTSQMKYFAQVMILVLNNILNSIHYQFSLLITFSI